MISHFFIDRPIFATVLSVVILIVGGVALTQLPIAQYPEVAPPTVQVTATYPGANAKTVADTVATPIEAEVNGVERMLYMSSKCTIDGQKKLVHAPIKVNSPSIANAGLAAGSTMERKIRNVDAPSIRAASMSS